MSSSLSSIEILQLRYLNHNITVVDLKKKIKNLIEKYNTKTKTKTSIIEFVKFEHDHFIYNKMFGKSFSYSIRLIFLNQSLELALKKKKNQI